MTTNDIEQWLGSMLPLERELRSWFYTHHSPMPKQVYLEKLDHFHEIASQGDRSFFVFDPEQQDFAKYAKTSNVVLSEHVCFQQDVNISIVKQPRYLPEIAHSNAAFDITYVFQGQGTQTFYQNGKEQTFQMKQGDISITQPCLETTKGIYSDDTIYLSILVKRSALQSSIATLIPDSPLLAFFLDMMYSTERKNCVFFSTGSDSYIKNLILYMMLELGQGEQYNQRVVLLMLGLIFLHLQRHYSNEIYFLNQESGQDRYIYRFYLYLNDNYPHFSLAEMGEYFHLSPEYISRLFKKATSQTITERLQIIRINAAKKLLYNTDMKIDDIAFHVGYDDCTYFIQVFKKLSGRTPLQFRKQIRSEML